MKLHRLMKILVIEDEPKTMAYLAKGLTENGYKVNYAGNGEEGFPHGPRKALATSLSWTSCFPARTAGPSWRTCAGRAIGSPFFF
jgi:hypothetical protein